MGETAPTRQWTRKHLLGLEGLTADEIRLVLDTADSFKEVSTRSVKKVPALRGKVVVNAFWEDSTRTRTSFELAAQRLSADVVDQIVGRFDTHRNADEVIGNSRTFAILFRHAGMRGRDRPRHERRPVAHPRRSHRPGHSPTGALAAGGDRGEC